MLKVSPELYIGSNELRRAFRAFREDGYQRLFSAFVQSYGVAYTKETSLQVVQGTTGPRWVTVKAGLAVDKDLNMIFISSDAVNAIQFPTDIGSTAYLCIRYKVRNTEDGTVNIATDGTVVGVGTEFTKVLRGAPLNQVKMRLPGSSSNLNDYPILEVIDDTHAILNTTTTLTEESDQKYAVVGCFTPSVSIPAANKLIYYYDDYELFFSNAVTADDLTFKLAQVNWNGSNLTITDTRLSNKLTLFDTTADLVNQITQTVIALYNLQIVTQFAAQIAAINAQLLTLAAADSDLIAQLTALSALVNQKANIAQENWRFIADPGENPFGAKFENALGGAGRTKFKKTTIGTVHLHCYVNCLTNAPFNDKLFVLPEGYRPTAAINLPATKWAGGGFPSACFISINTNGEVAWPESADLPAGQKIQFHTSFQVS